MPQAPEKNNPKRNLLIKRWLKWQQQHHLNHPRLGLLSFCVFFGSIFHESTKFRGGVDGIYFYFYFLIWGCLYMFVPHPMVYTLYKSCQSLGSTHLWSHRSQAPSRWPRDCSATLGCTETRATRRSWRMCCCWLRPTLGTWKCWPIGNLWLKVEFFFWHSISKLS